MHRNLARKLQKMNVSPAVLASAIEADQGPAGRHQLAVDEEHGRVGLKALWAVEDRLAHIIARLHAQTLAPLDEDVVEATLANYGHLHERQSAAVRMVAASPLSILTGGPGVGKSTVTKAIIEVAKAAQLTIHCCAPTGKAANRMIEATGHPATTVHRLLGMLMTEDGNPRQLNSGLVIIDEASMLSLTLAELILERCGNGTRVVLIGDVDQLPSIDPGRVLFDIISTGRLPVARLTHIFRQAAESRIPYIARAFNEGTLPADFASAGAGFAFVNVDDVYEAPATSEDYNPAYEDAAPQVAEVLHPVVQVAVDAVTKHLPTKYGFAPNEITVLAPKRQGKTGVIVINQQLQARINPGVESAFDVNIAHGHVARANDRVMFLRNDYTIDVFNGDQGTVVETNPQGIAAYRLAELNATHGDGKIVIVVRYPDPSDPTGKAFRHVGHGQASARDDLDLAYASTIHKSQGSQYRAVVLLATRSDAFMLNRALIYTGLTRASEYCAIIGQERTLRIGVANLRGIERRTRLAELIGPALASARQDEADREEAKRAAKVAAEAHLLEPIGSIEADKPEMADLGDLVDFEADYCEQDEDAAPPQLAATAPAVIPGTSMPSYCWTAGSEDRATEAEATEEENEAE